MTVTIHLPPGPLAQGKILRRLITLAGGDRRAVRSGHTGLVVSDELALAYLSEQHPALSNGDHTGRAMPPNLARVVRQAENTAGLLQSATPAATAGAEPAPQKTTRTPATRRPRRTQQGASA